MFDLKKRIKYFLGRKVIILMYHRIAGPDVDPWQLSVSAENFEQHLELLQSNKLVKSLPQVIEQLNKEKPFKKSIVVTFDDGYADNYLTALPLLKKYEVPATFFIASKHIGSSNEFWWDELANIILLARVLPATLLLTVNGQPFFYDLTGETSLSAEVLNKHKNYIAYQPQTLRSGLYFKLWEYMSPMHDTDQLKVMKQVRKWAGMGESSRPDYQCMSYQHVKELSTGKLFNVGGHTVSHPALSCHPKDIQYKEILDNKLFLEQITGKKISLFAYPSGKYNDSTMEIVKQTGFKAAVTTNATTVKHNANPFTLGRFQVNNYSGDQLRQLLLNWFGQ